MINKQISKEQQLLLQDIQGLEFAAYDIALYLDTHPNDSAALYRHKRITEQLRQLLYLYETQFGITSIMGTETDDIWRYVNGPWPWD